MFDGLLSITVFMPAAVAVLVALFARGGKADQQIRWIAIGATVVTFVLTVLIFVGYDRAEGGVQMVDYFERWIPVDALRSSYIMGVDGLSAPLVLLTGILGMAASFASWRIKTRVREYFLWLLLLETAVLGVFLSLDLLLFFIFFEFELIPMYMLIAIWGSGRPRYSAMKFVLFTLAGGALMLVGILALYVTPGVNTLAMVTIPELGITGIPELIAAADLVIPAALIFGFFFVAFAIKLPLWPVHSWLPDAHTDAPTAVSVMLAGVLLKMAGYGLLRINLGFFQETKGFTIAYSSVSHMGFVLLGIAAIGASKADTSAGGLNGAALQMFTHGTITGLAFLMVGLSYDRTHTRHIPHLGGLWKKMPLIAIFFLIAGFGSLGLPALSGFVAEIMVFLGTFSVWPWATGVAAFGVVLAAGYTLWMVQRVFFGARPANPGLSDEIYDGLEDASWVDMVPVIALAAPIFIIGVWPSVITEVFDIGIQAVLR